MIIVLGGHARSGKDTFAKFLQTHFTENYYTLAYANALKLQCMEDFGLVREQVFGDLKEVPDIRYVKETVGGKPIYWTPREILQHMGTEAYRTIDNDFWVKKLFKYVDRNKLSNVIITDGRFKNEVRAAIDRGGIYIKMVNEDDLEVHGRNHASETSLDYYDDHAYKIVENFGTLEELENKAKYIVKEIEKKWPTTTL